MLLVRLSTPILSFIIAFNRFSKLERVGVIAPQRPLESFESAANEDLGEVEHALILQQRAHVVDRRKRVGEIASQRPLASFER